MRAILMKKASLSQKCDSFIISLYEVEFIPFDIKLTAPVDALTGII